MSKYYNVADRHSDLGVSAPVIRGVHPVPEQKLHNKQCELNRLQKELFLRAVRNNLAYPVRAQIEMTK